MLDALRVKHPPYDLLREIGSRLRQVGYLYRPAVQRMGEEEDLKVRALGVFVHPGFGDVHGGKGLNVNA